MSKEKAKELIKARIKKNRSIKTKQSRRKGSYGLVCDFIHNMEDVMSRCKSELDFNMELQRESQLLLDRFKCIDPEVELELKWNRADKITQWSELLVEGVLIKWSRFYLRKHPLEKSTKYIDISELFLQGMLD
jgi:hypothetical protein